MNHWAEQSRIQVVARHAPHSRAALTAPRTTQRNQLLLVAQALAPLRRAAPRVRLAHAHRVRGRAVGAPGGRRWVSSWRPRALCRGSGAAPHAPRAASNRRLKLAGRYVQKDRELFAWEARRYVHFTLPQATAGSLSAVR
jgi:hypothetical protein